MKNYTMNLTEEELLYIRSALCDKNLKHTIKAIQAQKDGNKLAESYNMERHSIGHDLLNRIDSMREC